MIQGFLHSLTVVLEMFAIMAAAYIGRKKNALSEAAMKGITEVLMTIALPASILNAAHGVRFTSRTVLDIGMLLLIVFLSYLLMFALTYFAARFLKLKGKDKTVFAGVPVFKNVAFMGLPFCSAILGDWSTFYVAFCIIVFNLLMWTFGIFWYSGGKHFEPKLVLHNISLIACALMILLIVFNVSLPESVWTVFDMAGGVCTPLSLVVIGMMLADIRILDILKQPVYYLTSFFTLIAAPALMLILVSVFRPGQEVASVLLVLSTVPAATINPVVAQKYGNAGENASVAVVHSMILSLVTMPVLTGIFTGMLGY